MSWCQTWGLPFSCRVWGGGVRRLPPPNSKHVLPYSEARLDVWERLNWVVWLRDSQECRSGCRPGLQPSEGLTEGGCLVTVGWRPQVLTTWASLGLPEHPYDMAAGFTQSE